MLHASIGQAEGSEARRCVRSIGSLLDRGPGAMSKPLAAPADEKPHNTAA